MLCSSRPFLSWKKTGDRCHLHRKWWDIGIGPRLTYVLVIISSFRNNHLCYFDFIIVLIFPNDTHPEKQILYQITLSYICITILHISWSAFAKAGRISSSRENGNEWQYIPSFTLHNTKYMCDSNNHNSYSLHKYIPWSN